MSGKLFVYSVAGADPVSSAGLSSGAVEAAAAAAAASPKTAAPRAHAPASIGAAFFDAYIPEHPAAVSTGVLPHDDLPLGDATVSDAGVLRLRSDADSLKRRRDPAAQLEREATLSMRDVNYWLAEQVAGELGVATEVFLVQPQVVARVQPDLDVPQPQKQVAVPRASWLPATYSFFRVLLRMAPEDKEVYERATKAPDAAQSTARAVVLGLVRSWASHEWIDAGNAPIDSASPDTLAAFSAFLDNQRGSLSGRLRVLEALRPDMVTADTVLNMFTIKQSLEEVRIMKRQQPNKDSKQYETLPGYDTYLAAAVTSANLNANALFNAVRAWDAAVNNANLERSQREAAARPPPAPPQPAAAGLGQNANPPGTDIAIHRDWIKAENTGVVKLAPTLTRAMALTLVEIRKIAPCSISNEWSLIRFGSEDVQSEYVSFIALMIRKKEMLRPRRTENVIELRKALTAWEIRLKVRFRTLRDQLGTGVYVFGSGRASVAYNTTVAHAFLAQKSLHAYVPGLDREWESRGFLRTGDEIEEWERSKEVYDVTRGLRM